MGLSTGGTLVLSEPDILSHYSLLSLDNKSEANILDSLRGLGLWGITLGSKAMSSAHTQFFSPAKVEDGVGEDRREDWSCRPPDPSWADNPTIYFPLRPGAGDIIPMVKCKETNHSCIYTRTPPHTHIQTLIPLGGDGFQNNGPEGSKGMRRGRHQRSFIPSFHH